MLSDDKILKVLSKNGNLIIYFRKVLDNERFVLRAVKSRGTAIQYVSTRLRYDPKIVRVAMETYGEAINFMVVKFAEYRESILNSLNCGNVKIMKHIPISTYKKLDREIILLAIKKGAKWYHCLDERHREDRELILEAFKMDIAALCYASCNLTSDRKFMMDAIRKNGYALTFASKELRADREAVLTAVKTYSIALKYASAELRADREIILEAVRNDGYAYKYVNRFYEFDREIILTAIRSYPNIIITCDCDERPFRSDYDLVLEAVKGSGRLLMYAHDTLRANYNIVLCAVKNYGMALLFASDDLRANREIVEEAVKNNSQSLKYCDETLYYEFLHVCTRKGLYA